MSSRSRPAQTPAAGGDASVGLTTGEAARRLAADGPNAIEEHRPPAIVRLLRHWWGPIPWMIEVALALSLVTSKWADAAIIGLLLLLNGGVSFWEEHQAGDAIDALRARLAAEALVRRDGDWQTLDARFLVAGDLIRVRLGDIVPADARLTAGSDLEVDQSALTGESLPVTRHLDDDIYSGSVVTLGEADATVTATGPRTYFGHTAELVSAAGTVSHFQRAVLRIARQLVVMAVILIGLIVVVGLARGTDLPELGEFALVVAIASIPVALPAVLSVTMAVGAAELAREQAVVSHLAAVEELGGVDVLCSDKTGTLTRNELAAGEPIPQPGVEPDDVLRWAALACQKGTRDVIDRAVVAAARDLGAAPDTEPGDFVPFDPMRKRSEATVRWGDATVKVTKGAPQVIAALLAPGDPESERARVAATSAVERLAEEGFRSLAVARTDDHGVWRLLGVIPLADPPREDSRGTIEAARGLGVSVKMVTGDQSAIARRIALDVGLGDRIVAAHDLDTDDPDRLAAQVEGVDGFAEVFPEHKFRIVEALQRRGHLVGMTGDGVNDAPALKQADAGTAVHGATDAARSAADIVLLAPGLRVIVSAIRTSREIFERMTSYAIFRVTETIRVLFFVTAAIVAFNLFPVTPVMIVLLALLNDGAILAIAYDRTTAAPEPVRWDTRGVLVVAAALGVSGLVGSFTFLAVARAVRDLPLDELQTLMYLKLSVAGHLTIFLTRTRGPFWSSRPSRLLLGAVLGTQALATFIAVYGIVIPPVGWGWAAAVWGFAMVMFLINDGVKLLTYRWLDSHPARGAEPVTGRRNRRQRS